MRIKFHRLSRSNFTPSNSPFKGGELNFPPLKGGLRGYSLGVPQNLDLLRLSRKADLSSLKTTFGKS